MGASAGSIPCHATPAVLSRPCDRHAPLDPSNIPWKPGVGRPPPSTPVDSTTWLTRLFRFTRRGVYRVVKLIPGRPGSELSHGGRSAQASDWQPGVSQMPYSEIQAQLSKDPEHIHTHLRPLAGDFLTVKLGDALQVL